MLIPLRWNPGSQRNLDFGVALTQAMNSWQVERWVKNEPRLRASILVAQEDTARFGRGNRCAGKRSEFHADPGFAADR